jgi:hypothetical protein
MDINWNPAPKPVPKDKPKYKKKRYPTKKKKKPLRVKGRVIPPAKQRSAISKKEYTRAVEAFGSVCVFCGSPRVEMHHIRFRSQQGRGNFRNLIPLCKEHHMMAHSNREFNDSLKESRIELYGNWFWADKYDLFQANIIPNTDEKTFEAYMLSQEKG